MTRAAPAFSLLIGCAPDLSDASEHREIKLTHWFASVSRAYEEFFQRQPLGSVPDFTYGRGRPGMTPEDALAWLEYVATVHIDRVLPPGDLALALACFTMTGMPVLSPRLAGVDIDPVGLVVFGNGEVGPFRITASHLVGLTNLAMARLCLAGRKRAG
jgi:hypothetical protein